MVELADVAGNEFVTPDIDTCAFAHAFGDSRSDSGPSFVIELETHHVARTVVLETLPPGSGSYFDTMLFVSPTCSSDDIIARDDDGGPGLLSKLTFNLSANQGEAGSVVLGGLSVHPSSMPALAPRCPLLPSLSTIPTKCLQNASAK